MMMVTEDVLLGLMKVGEIKNRILEWILLLGNGVALVAGEGRLRGAESEEFALGLSKIDVVVGRWKIFETCGKAENLYQSLRTRGLCEKSATRLSGSSRVTRISSCGKQ